MLFRSGIHRELLGGCKTYRDLWEAQSALEHYANDAKGQSLRIISDAEEGEVSAND